MSRETKKILSELKKLSFHPGASSHTNPCVYVRPDVFLKQEQKKWTLEINENDLPSFQINPQYLSLLKEKISAEEKQTLRTFITKGKWLMRSINRRRKILRQIALYIVKRQSPFLNGKAPLAPLSAKEIATDLQLNESTVARALTEKYIATPIGIKPLRFFLSHAIDETHSTHAAKEALQNILSNKDCPSSDRLIAEKLHQQGFCCSRRTVAKYRKSMRK